MARKSAHPGHVAYFAIIIAYYLLLLLIGNATTTEQQQRLLLLLLLPPLIRELACPLHIAIVIKIATTTTTTTTTIATITTTNPTTPTTTTTTIIATTTTTTTTTTTHTIGAGLSAQNDAIAKYMDQIDSCEETCLQVHLASGSGPWERARLSGGLRNLVGLTEIGLDHSPFGQTVLKQLQGFAAQLQPVPLKVNVRAQRPG